MSMLKACNSGAVPTLDLTNGLVAHYLLNNNADDSYGTYDGTSTNGVDFQGDCAEFNGVDNFVSTKITNSLFHAVSFWAFIGYDGAINGRTAFGNGNFSRRIHISSYVDASNQPTVYIQWRDGTTSGTYNYQNYHSTSTIPDTKGEWIHFYVERQVGTRYDRVFCNGVECVLGSSLYDGDTSKEFYDEIDMGYVTLNIEDTFYAGQASNVRFYSDSKDQAFIDALYAEGYYPKSLPLPTTDGLVSYHPLTGTAEDKHGTYDGIENGGLAYIDDDEFGSSGNFDGVNDYVKTTAGSAVLNGDITMSVWAKLDADATTARIAISQSGGDGATTRSISITTLYRVIAQARDASGAYFSVIKTLVAGEQTKWMHIVQIDRGTTTELYFNGEFVGSVERGSNYTFNDEISVGCVYRASGNSYYLDGKIRNARVYSRALLAQEVTDIYNYEKNFRSIDIDNGLMGYYLFKNNGLDNYGIVTQYDFTDTNVTYDGNSALYQGDGYSRLTSFPSLYKTIPLTLSAWVKFDSLANRAYIVDFFEYDTGNNNTYNGGFHLYIDNNSGDIRIASGYTVVSAETTTDSNGNTNISDQQINAYSSFIPTTGVWYHVVGVFHSKSAELYINGELDSAVTSVGSAKQTNTNDNYGIGALVYDATRNYFLNGRVARVRNYKYDLTKERIREIHNAEKGDFGL